MKFISPKFRRLQARNGSAILVVLTMLAIMVTLVTVNIIAVKSLGRELKLMEKTQRQRLERDHQNRAEPLSKDNSRG